MRWLGEYWYVGIGLLAAAVAGCGEELGPERFVTARVSGRVTVGGRPVGKGWVEFLPIDGTVGKLRSAALGPDGRFTADGVAVGWNRVGVVGAPISMEHTGMFHPFSTPIRRKITAQTEPLDLDLLTEAIRSQRTKTASPSASSRRDPPR